MNTQIYLCKQKHCIKIALFYCNNNTILFLIKTKKRYNTYFSSLLSFTSIICAKNFGIKLEGKTTK